MGAVNEQYSNPAAQIVPGSYDSTGAPGSPGDSAGETSGPVVGSPVVSNPQASSQVPENMPRVSVTAGDTSGMSSDQAVQASPITPGPVAGYLSTGAGQGNPNPYRHPNGA